eukprot:4038121-Amphidinium_carterae.1
MLLMGIGLQPLEKLLFGYFKLASSEWQQEQIVAAMQDVLAGNTPRVVVRLEVAASLELETKFFDELSYLYSDTAVWQLIPRRCHTHHFRSKCFQLVSRLGAVVQKYVANPHMCYPTKLWLLLQHPSKKYELLLDPPCLHDSETKALLELFPNLDTPAFYATLRAQGTWRAFVKYMSTGSEGLPDLHRLANLYQQHMQDGTLVADKVRATDQLTSRAQRYCRRHGVILKAQRGKARDIARQQLLCDQFLAQTHGHSLLQQASSITQRFADDELEKALMFAKAVQKHMCKVQVGKQDVQKHVMEEFKNTKGAQMVAALHQQYPALRKWDFQAVPLPGVSIFQVDSGKLVEQAVQSTAAVVGSQKSNLGPALDKLWSKMHETMSESASGSATLAMDEDEECEEVGGMMESTCQTLGICVCSTEGKDLKKLHNQYLKALKEAFSTKDSKLLLSSGMIVVKCSVSADTTCAKLQEYKGPQEYYWHIAHMSWKPYGSTLQKLTLVHNPEAVEVPSSVCLQALPGTSFVISDTHCHQAVQMCSKLFNS